MDYPLIRKHPSDAKRPANLAEYDEAYSSFTWEAAKRLLAGLPHGCGLNIAHEAVDRHVAEGHGDRIALRWIAKEGAIKNYRYRELSELSNRFANVLQALGVGPGERVFTLLGRVPELYVTALGTWKRGAVFCPLFPAFGPAPVKARMLIAEPTVLVTTPRLYQRKIAPIRDELPFLKHVILAGGDRDGCGVPDGPTPQQRPHGTHRYREERVKRCHRVRRRDHGSGCACQRARQSSGSDLQWCHRRSKHS